MPYPEELIGALTVKHALSAVQQQLYKTLVDDEIRPIVEAGKFDSENFLLQLDLPEGPYVSVLSPVAGKKIITDTSLLETLKISALSHIETFKEWEKIKIAIEAINQLPRSRTRQRKQKATELFTQLLSVQNLIMSHSVWVAEHFALSEHLLQYMNAMLDPIKNSATEYFTTLFQRIGRNITDISFTAKKAGVQLGCTIIITYTESEVTPKKEDAAATSPTHRIAYYIKTHQHGRTSEASSIKPIDLKELFVYKVLEYIGYGPKAHFFFNHLSPGGFFIGTQDLAFTKVFGKEKSFTLFATLMKSYNEMPQDPGHDAARKALICFDILSRIFRLRDTTTNPENFGIVTVERVKSKWKLLDFRVLEDAELYCNPNIFDGFQKGNGVFNYDYADFLKYTFKDPVFEKKKITMAHEILNELYAGRTSHGSRHQKITFPNAITRASQEIQQYAKDNADALKIDLDSTLADLQQYNKAININLTTLATGIHQRYNELSQEMHSRTISQEHGVTNKKPGMRRTMLL